MRTTIDIPGPLLRRAKAAAALEGKTLKTVVAEALEQRLRSGALDVTPTRVSLPLVPSNNPGSLRLTGEDVARALTAEDLDAAAGR